VINGVHAMLYAQDPAAARAFLSDVLDLSSVDAGGGWLVFRLPPAELGVHPSDDDLPSGSHGLFLLCDDVTATVADLRGKGVTVGEISDQGWGLLASVTVPGAGSIGLYQPRHPTAHD
jgi:catechol 2,3-dioxygenase-like lactoylglutathione lyase family enzyme